MHYVIVRKCPSCNSTKIGQNEIRGQYVTECRRCGYVNKKKIPDWYLKKMVT